MQQLKFEPSWDKALSSKDRIMFQKIFTKTCVSDTNRTQLVPVWHASNYKGELLITVLIHNFTNQTLTFHNTILRYIEGDNVAAEHIFTHPSLIIEPEVSMPWTFIFPVECLNNPANRNGLLEILS